MRDELEVRETCESDRSRFSERALSTPGASPGVVFLLSIRAKEDWRANGKGYAAYIDDIAENDPVLKVINRALAAEGLTILTPRQFHHFRLFHLDQQGGPQSGDFEKFFSPHLKRLE